MRDYLAKRYIKDSSIVFRKVADEFILVPIKQKADEVESIFTVNQVGSCIWELIDGEKSLGEILDMIVSEFDVKPEEAEADLIEFVKQLDKIGAVRVI